MERRSESGGGSRRRLLLAGAGGVTGLALGACGTAGGRDGGPAPGAQPVTLEFQHRWEGARTEVVDRVVALYQQARPQVRVNSQLVFGNGEGFFDGMPYDKILAQISAGTPPDVIMMGSDVAAAWARRQGALRPLDEPLKRDKVEPEKLFYPALAQMARAQGRYQGLPQLTATDRAYLFMNKDSVDGAGLNSAAGPRSWEELVSWSQRLTRREGDGFGQVGLSIGGTPFIDWLARNNGKVLSDDGTRVAFDQPAGQATLEWMLDATQRLYGSQQAYADALRNQANAKWTGRQTLWVGQVAEFFIVLNDGPKANPAFKPAVVTVPHNAQNAQARPLSLAEKIWMYSQAGGTSGPRLDAGYDFLRFLTTGEGNKAFVLAQGRPSPVVKFNDDPAFKQANPWWDTVVKQGLSLMTPMAQ
ncbi:MAG TPA: extracellular solute-binding protein, partial [Chloroflexota bacterium]|nr:extracellular solute-binding protein [Chloroflexota bacterium]